jgi:poly-gamma-glutamate synthesis protein (capsule biosynthesis protein)
MTGRGIDQVLPHPCKPQLFESWVRSASSWPNAAAAPSAAGWTSPIPGAKRWRCWSRCGRTPGSGVNFLDHVSERSAGAICKTTAPHRHPGDDVVVSVHWGGNWGYAIPREHRAFAHRLIDGGGADIVHGHSSHHVKGIEVWHGKLILYGCGDFLNDYEGIGGHAEFRGELSLMYFPELDPATGRLRQLRAVAMRTRRFRLERAPAEGVGWLCATLDREGKPLGTHLAAEDHGGLTLGWEA